MRLTVHKNGAHDANRNGNITHNRLTVVALRINRQNQDYGHSRKEWSRIPSIRRNLLELLFRRLAEQEVSPKAECANGIGQERLQFVYGHFLPFQLLEDSVIGKGIER